MREKPTNKNIDHYKRAELYTALEEQHPMMQQARQSALDYSLTPTFPIGIVIVKEGKIITHSANGNGYHEKHITADQHRGGCKRRYLSKKLEMEGKEKLKSGEGFELCTGCDTDYHAEARAIAETADKSLLNGADLYMYGHWWCCKDCWDKMEAVGIKQVYVLEKFRDKEALIEWRNEFQQLRDRDA